MTYRYAKDELNNNREDVIVMIKDDGTVCWVPNCAENSDWQKYQEWLALGNTPDPAE